MAFSLLAGFSRRFFVRQQIVVASLRTVTNSNRSFPKVLSEFRLNDEDHDPDVFGTLTSSSAVLSTSNISKQTHQFIVSPSVGSLMESKEEIIDEGDAKEEEYLSFDPVDRKSFKDFEREVQQLVLKDKRLKEALQLLEVTMKQDKVKPSRDIYSMLIGACGKAGYSKKAFSLYNDMKKRGFEPTDSHYTALFNACANSPMIEDGLKRATKLRRQLSEKNVILNRAQYHAMMKAFGRCRDVETAFQIAEEMASNQLPVTTETLSFLLQACISQPKDGFSQAIIVWRKMRKFQVTPSTFSYNLMLRATRDCGAGDKKGNQPSLINSLLLTEGVSTINLDKSSRKLLESDESSPNVTTLVTTNSDNNQPSVLPNLLAETIESNNVAIALTSLDLPENRLALLGNVEGFLNEMRNDYAKPDIKTFTLLVETMASDSSQENRLIKLMTEEFKVKPDVDFFNLLIKKRQMRLDHVAVKEAMGYLQIHNLYPNIMTFGVLALGCRTIPDTIKLMTTMDESGFRLNHEIFGSLLKNAVYRRNCWFVIFLINKAFKLGLTLDERSIKLLVRFKEESSEAMAQYDRGVKVHEAYGTSKFVKGFRAFCLEYKEWLKRLEVDLEPRPWEQYQYKIPRQDENKKVERNDGMPINVDIKRNITR